MKTAVLVAASIALFLAAAKVHGRALRLERERTTGVMHVDFRGTNPPAVLAIWSAERVRFWTLTPILAALAALIAWKLAGAPTRVLVLAAITWAPALSFTVLGILAHARIGDLARTPTGDGVTWWSVLAATAIAVIVALRAGG